MKNIYRSLLFAIFISVTFIHAGTAQILVTSKDDYYKDWGYSPSGAFGIIKLDHPHNRGYYKIIKNNNESVKIQEFNAAGILKNAILIRLVNNRINQMTSTDQWGQNTEITKFTLGAPNEFFVTKRNTGQNSYRPCKGAKYIYNDNLLSEIRYFSYDNKLINNSAGVAMIKYKRYTDNKRYSLVKEMAFYDADNKPVISSSYDCHKVIYEYDEKANETSVSYYGTDNEPLVDRYGGFKTRYTYDENDQESYQEIIGINDEVTKNAYGVAKVSYDYKDGFCSKITYKDEHDNITKSSNAGNGLAIITYEYDNNGNETSESYFDENNHSMNNTSGYHKIIYEYDNGNMNTGLAYFDASGSPASNKTGIHKYVYARDEKGRLVQQAFFDNNNTPMKDPTNEVYMMKYKYDDWGRTTSESYWENSTTKMNRWDGRHESVYRYNEDGQDIEDLFLDQGGNQFVTKSGFSRVINLYNKEARLAEFQYYTKETPVSLDSAFSTGFHSVRFDYDANGRKSSLRYFDNYGKPVDATINLGDGFKCHKVDFIYKGSRIVEERIYTRDSNVPVKIIDCLSEDYVAALGINKGYKNR